MTIYEAHWSTGDLQADTMQEAANKFVEYHTDNAGWKEARPSVTELIIYDENDNDRYSTSEEFTEFCELVRTLWDEVVAQIQSEVDHERSLKAGA